MIVKNDNSKREQYIFISLEDLVPEDHPSMGPFILIKLSLIQYLFRIKSMYQTIKEILSQCFYKGLVDTDTVFVGGTHVKANNTNNKSISMKSN